MAQRYPVSKLTQALQERYGETRSYLCHSDERRNGRLPMLIEERGRFYFEEDDLPEIAEALGIRVSPDKPKSRARSETSISAPSTA